MIDWLDLNNTSPNISSRSDFGFNEETLSALNGVLNNRTKALNNTAFFRTNGTRWEQHRLALSPLALNDIHTSLYWERGNYPDIRAKLERTRQIPCLPNQYRIFIGITTIDIISAFEQFKSDYSDAREYSIGLMETARHKIRVAIDKENHLVFVLTSRSTELSNLMRRMVSLLPVMFDIDLTQLQYPIPDTLFKLLWKSYAEWHTAFSAWFAQTNWIEQIRTNRIKDSLISFQHTRIANVKRQVQKNKAALNDLLANYGKLHMQNVDLQNMLVGMQQGTGDVSEQLRFIANVPNLYVFEPTSDYLRIALATPAVNYDLALIRRIVVNPSSTLNERIREVYDSTTKKTQRAAMRRLIELVFCEQKYVMYFNYACQINKTGISGIAIGELELLGLPNPHLAGYSCWGSAAPYVIKAYNEGDLVGCLQYVINAIANMNFADSTVVRKLITYVALAYDNQKKVLQDPTTKIFYSIQEVLTRETDSTGRDDAEQADRTAD